MPVSGTSTPSTVVAGDSSDREQPSGHAPESADAIDVRAALQQALALLEAGSAAFEDELSRLSEIHGPGVRSELIHLLCHLRFEPDEGRAAWERIRNHRRAMQTRLGRPVDLRVALVSYFVEVDRRLRNPKIIELRLFEQTQASAYRDELTGLPNFRYLGEYMAQELARCDQFQLPLSVIMVDVDHFKHFNDRNGHQAGNRVLSEVAKVLQGCVRRVDVVARYGGEEFTMVLPSTPKQGAHRVAERARAAIEAHEFEHGSSQPGGTLSVSLGVATYPADADEHGSLLRCADRALYNSKTAGRNRVSLYGDSSRSFRRFPAALTGSYANLGTDRHDFTTLQVGQGGLLMRTDRTVHPGMLLDVELGLGPGETVGFAGRALSARPLADGAFEVSLRFHDLSGADRWRLTHWLRNRTGGDAQASGTAD